MTALEFLERLRYELSEINNKILRHRFITEIVEGKLDINKIKDFAEQQFYIASNDAKALAIMYSRSNFPENDFFLKLLIEHQEALKRLMNFLKNLNVDVSKIKPKAQTVAFTHFFFKLAFLHNIEEQIVCILINFPIFIENLNKIGKALKEKYNIQEVSFFEEAKWDKELEFLALKILENYKLGENVKISARLIQEYELMYWDSFYI